MLTIFTLSTFTRSSPPPHIKHFLLLNLLTFSAKDKMSGSGSGSGSESETEIYLRLADEEIQKYEALILMVHERIRQYETRNSLADDGDIDHNEQIRKYKANMEFYQEKRARALEMKEKIQEPPTLRIEPDGRLVNIMTGEDVGPPGWVVDKNGKVRWVDPSTGSGSRSGSGNGNGDGDGNGDGNGDGRGAGAS